MIIRKLNREEGVGASSYYLELGVFKFLVDAGLNPDKIGYDAVPDYSHIKGIPLDYIFITHAHLDHIGSLPLVLRNNPKADIITSYGTRLLLGRMLYNSLSVMIKQRDKLKIAAYPLYTKGDIAKVEDQLRHVHFHTTYELEKEGEELKVTFFPAGHIAGAAGILFQWKDKKIFFTGDVSFTPQYTVCGAQFPLLDVDVVVLETTRGNTIRKYSKDIEEQRLVTAIVETLRKGGSCLIPVFALGRTQEILCILHKAYKTKVLPKVPVFCTGLGIDLMNYYEQISRQTPQLVKFKKQIVKDLNVKYFDFDVESGSNLEGPAIYLLSNGMMVEDTPSYLAAAAMMEFPENAIFFVGYSDPKTPGGQFMLLKEGDSYHFQGLDYTANLHASKQYFDLSAHADRDELINYIQKVNVSTIILSHGDPEAKDWMAHALLKIKPHLTLIKPSTGQTINL